jgi:hypothetical protein
MRDQIKHRAFTFFGHQAKASGDFLICLGFASQIATETVLVKLLTGFKVPQAAAIWADLIGQDDAAEIAII